MSVPHSVRASRRLVMLLALAAVTLGAGSACIGGSDAFAGPECETPGPTVPPDTNALPDSGRADPPPPTTDVNPCSAPDV